MLIPGIHCLKQLTNGAYLGWLGARREIAIDLYSECSNLRGEQRERLQEVVLRKATTSNSAFKRTQANRFESFDKSIAGLLDEMNDVGFGMARVHDVAISDGRTTVAFYELLRRVYGSNFALQASDLDLEFCSLNLGKRSRVIFDSRGTCLQLIVVPFVFNLANRSTSKLAAGNSLLSHLIVKFGSKRLSAEIQDRRAEAISVTTLCRECLELKKTTGNISFHERNILEPVNEKFDIVRAMNVLNRSYFNSKQLNLALRNIHESLTSGGIFITGSNQDSGSLVLGTVFRKTSTGFEPVLRNGGGSPIEAIIESYDHTSRDGGTDSIAGE